MRITYYALRPIQVGDEMRQAGDLVPEAQDWPYLSGYVAEAKIAPVLVATLPEAQQEMLLAWEEDVYGPAAVDIAVNGPDEEIDKIAPDTDADDGVVVVAVPETEDVLVPRRAVRKPSEKVT